MAEDEVLGKKWVETIWKRWKLKRVTAGQKDQRVKRKVEEGQDSCSSSKVKLISVGRLEKQVCSVHKSRQGWLIQLSADMNVEWI